MRSGEHYLRRYKRHRGARRGRRVGSPNDNEALWDSNGPAGLRENMAHRANDSSPLFDGMFVGMRFMTDRPTDL